MFIIKKEKGREGEDMKDTGISDYKEKASHGDVLMPIQRYRCICPFTGMMRWSSHGLKGGVLIMALILKPIG